jgi:hypothetical protein
MWKKNKLHVYTDLRLSHDAHQRLISLTTHIWDEEMDEMLRLVLPRGAHMCKWQVVTTLFETQEQDSNASGLQSSVDFVSTTLDLSLVLQQRAWRLLKEGLIKHGEELRVHVTADAAEIFNSTAIKGTVVVLKVISLRITDAM